MALDESMTEMEEDKKDELDESIDDETTEEIVFKNESEDKPTDESKDELIVENTSADNNAEEIIEDNSQTKSEEVENENESTETKVDHVEDDDEISEVEKTVEHVPKIEINITDDTENEPDLMECTPDKVQIKIEPIDITDCEDQIFDFENVVIKTEPIDPEPGKFFFFHNINLN